MKNLSPEQKEEFKKEIIRVSAGSHSRIEDAKNDLKLMSTTSNRYSGLNQRCQKS